MPVTMHVDLSQAKRIERILRSAARDTSKATASAINDTTRGMRTIASREIRQSLSAKKKVVDYRLQREFASHKRLSGSITIKDRPELPLKTFRPRQLKSGVSVRIRKGESMTRFKSAFGPKIKRLGGHVYRRKGKQRLPIVRLPGVSLAKEATAVGAVQRVRREAPALLQKNLRRRIDLIAIRRAKEAQT